MIDPFELLGLCHETCTLAQARDAFADLVLLVHPDKGGASADMRVISSAYRYVRRCIKAKASIEMDFEEYCRDFDDGSTFEPLDPEEKAACTFDPDHFNRAFESRDPHAVYVGPAPDEPREGHCVHMAAAGAGTNGEGYGVGPYGECGERDDIESKVVPLVRNQLTVHRELPALLPRILPEHGPRTLDITDYADAFAAVPICENNFDTQRTSGEDVPFALDKLIVERASGEEVLGAFDKLLVERAAADAADAAALDALEANVAIREAAAAAVREAADAAAAAAAAYAAAALTANCPCNRGSGCCCYR